MSNDIQCRQCGYVYSSSRGHCPDCGTSKPKLKSAEMLLLEAANAELLAVLGDVWYALEKARIWGGMEWKYNPLHPVHYLPARDKARAAIKKHGGTK